MITFLAILPLFFVRTSGLVALNKLVILDAILDSLVLKQMTGFYVCLMLLEGIEVIFLMLGVLKTIDTISSIKFTQFTTSLCRIVCVAEHCATFRSFDLAPKFRAQL